jgi:glutamate-1-semialdehyde aminotransferase
MSQRKSFAHSASLLARAKRVIPSASQTYSKSYRYYCEGAAPAFLERGQGSHVWDVDGNEYIDFLMALGPITLGYGDPVVNEAIQRQLRKGIIFSQPCTLEVELAERLVEIVPCAEMVRFVKNGSDATAAAIRLARAFTGRDLVLSCGYHGMQDWYIGSSENNLGVPEPVQALVKTFPYDDADALANLLDMHRGNVAAVILEPVRTQEPTRGYLDAVRALADKHSAVLVFDEVVTGFRLALGGAQEYYGVTPDLSALGKGMANGMPLSAVVGKAEIMQLADEGAFVSLTFGGEALSLSACMATIDELQRREVCIHTASLGTRLRDGAKTLIDKHGLNDIAYVSGTKAMPAVFFKAWGDAAANDVLAVFQQEVIERDVLFLGVNYFCASHTEADVEAALEAYDYGFKRLIELKDGAPLSALLRGETYRPIFKRNKH